jgi:hypothetical protein
LAISRKCLVINVDYANRRFDIGSRFVPLEHVEDFALNASHLRREQCPMRQNRNQNERRQRLLHEASHALPSAYDWDSAR